MFSNYDVNTNIIKYVNLCDIVCMRHTCKSLTNILVKESKDNIMRRVVYYNDPTLLQYFIDVGYPLPKNYQSYVVIDDKLILLKYLYKNYKIELNKELLDIAYNCNALDIACWLHKKYVKSEVIPTTRNGQYLKICLNTGQWDLIPESLEFLCIDSSYKGYLNILKCIPSDFLKIPSVVLFSIANNKIHILEYVYPFIIVEEYYLMAIERGHLNIIEWLYSKEEILTKKMFNTAIEKGYFDIISWLYNHNCPYDKYACSSANELYILKWLREMNVPWDYSVILTAENNGNTRMVKWASENGCTENLGTDIFNIFD